MSAPLLIAAARPLLPCVSRIVQKHPAYVLNLSSVHAVELARAAPLPPPPAAAACRHLLPSH